MAKPDPALLDPARYPFRCEIEPRFSDLDVNQHINNVALVDILQEGRVRFHHASGFSEGLGALSSMVASFAVDYLGQAHHAQPLTNYLGAETIGRSSHTLTQLVMQGEAVIALARTVLVCVENGRPAANPTSFQEEVKSWMLGQ